MKKGVLFLFILIAFVYMKPVFAADVSVCDSGCDYTSIDDALNAIEDGAYSEYVNMNVSTWNEQSLSNHILSVPVIINFSRAGVIDGAGATIRTDQDINISGSNVDFKNVNIIYTGEFEVWNDGINVPESVLYFSGGNIRVLNLHLSSQQVGVCSQYPDGIDSDANNTSIENSTIENFGTGIYSNRNLNVDGSTLHNNFLSIYAGGNGALSNSKIHSVFSYGSFAIQDNNDLGDAKVTIVQEEDYDALTYEQYCNKMSNNSIYVDANSPFVSVAMKKTMNINFNQQQSIDDMLGIFKNLPLNDQNFTYHSEDDTIAKVQNNKITILKTGEVTIQAINEDTKENYSLHLVITSPLVNPATGRSVIAIIIGLILLGSLSVYYHRSKREQ